jgi:hypothetical protein
LAALVAGGGDGQGECLVEALVVVEAAAGVEAFLAGGQLGPVVRSSSSALRVRWKRSSLPWVWG